jgi:hypothetical protein
VLINSRHKHVDGLDDLDPYFTRAEAINTFILLEGDRLPRFVVEPMCGDGAIVKALRATGRRVIGSDVHDYGAGFPVRDYFAMDPVNGFDALVTNPPYEKALEILKKALAEYPYVALLIRTNFLKENVERGRWLDRHEPARVYLPCPRFPMMHRYGWHGNVAGSNTQHCWAVWQRGAPREFELRVYWRELLGAKPARRRSPAKTKIPPLLLPDSPPVPRCSIPSGKRS